MATAPIWFDYSTYMNNKVASLNATDPGKWDVAKVEAAFKDAGFEGKDGAYAHFMAYGKSEDVSPNPFFNAEEYYAAKAVSLGWATDPKQVKAEDVAKVKQAFADAGLDAWTHYQQYGVTEGINPSNGFDTAAYLQAKADALNADKIGEKEDWKPADVAAAFKEAGLSALDHYILYAGKGEDGSGEVVCAPYEPAKPAVPTEFEVPADKQVGAVIDGDILVLSEASKIAQLSAKNDVVDAYTNVDSIDGATVLDSTTTDNDTINAVITQNSKPANVLNVENINVDFKGFNLEFDATNVMYGAANGATNIVVSTKTQGNDAATIKGLGNKNVDVTVGEGIKTLNLDGVSTSDATKVFLAGDKLALNNTTDNIENITFVSNHSPNVVTIDNAGGATGVTYTAAGNQDLTLKGNTADLSNINYKKDAGYAGKYVLEVTNSASGGDFTNAGKVDAIKLTAAGSGTGTFANNANISLAHASALSGMTLEIGTSGVTKGALNLSVDAANASAGQSIKFGAEVATLNLTTNEVLGTSAASSATLDFAGTSGKVTKTVNFTGAKDVFTNITSTTVGTGTDDTIAINAGELGGKLNLTAKTAASGADNFNITGSKQNDTIELQAGTGSGTSIVSGGVGDDTITLSGGAANHTVKIFGDAGNDIFKFNTVSTGTTTVDGGADNDTFIIDQAGATDANVSLIGGAGVDTYVVSLGSGTGYTVTDFNVTEDRIVLSNTTASTGIDLTAKLNAGKIGDATIVFSNNGTALTDSAKAFASLGTADKMFKADLSATGRSFVGGDNSDFVITSGTSGEATFELGKGADLLHLAAGSETGNTIVIKAGDSAVNAIDRIIGFSAGATGDILDVTATVIISTSGQKIDLTGSSISITASNASGIYTVAGSTDIATIGKALADTEALDGKVLAFALNGNTYVFEGSATAGADNLIELVGVNGVQKLAGSEGADTIVIA